MAVRTGAPGKPRGYGFRQPCGPHGLSNQVPRTRHWSDLSPQPGAGNAEPTRGPSLPAPPCSPVGNMGSLGPELRVAKEANSPGVCVKLLTFKGWQPTQLKSPRRGPHKPSSGRMQPMTACSLPPHRPVTTARGPCPPLSPDSSPEKTAPPLAASSGHS